MLFGGLQVGCEILDISIFRKLFMWVFIFVYGCIGVVVEVVKYCEE